MLATAALLIFAAVHVSGRRQTARVQGSITLLKLCGLVAFACAGLSFGWRNSANLLISKPVDGKLAVSLDVFDGLHLLCVHRMEFGGVSGGRDPRSTARFCHGRSCLARQAVTVLYLALNVVYALALSAADVRAIVDDPSNHAGREAVAPIAQIAAARLFGPQWSTAFSIAFGMMLLSTLSAYVLIGPRVVYAMARAGQFPSIAARLTTRAGTPAVATVLQTGVALVLLWTGSFENLIIYAGVGLSIFSMLAVSSIYVLRFKQPVLHRPFRTPGYPVTPAVFLLVTGAAGRRDSSRAPPGFSLCGRRAYWPAFRFITSGRARFDSLTCFAKSLN